MYKGKILVADDDASIRQIVQLLMEKEGYTVITASDGEEAVKKMDNSFDLIILDIMMPKKDGISACMEIRNSYNVPILFLTAKGTEIDLQVGFSVGCDDYISKPFSNTELSTRVQGLIRRYTVYKGKSSAVFDSLRIGDIYIDEKSNQVLRDGSPVSLTDTEYRILHLLAKNPRKVFTLQNIYESIWTEPYDYSCNSTIMVHITNIRKKLEIKGNPTKYIKNIWGRGYCIEPPDK